MNAAAAHVGYGRREHRGMITLTVMVATVLPSLDTTIANVALPRMQGSLSATQDQMTWVLTSYIVATAIMTTLSGWLADRFGRKPVFLFSIVVFTIASALCGLAQTLTQAVLFRVLQGIGGAALIPMSQAVLFDSYPREQHARAMGIWALGVMLAPMLGPILGGWLTDNYTWRWVFLINIPFGIMAVYGVLKYLPDTTHEHVPFDFFGFATLGAFVGTLQVMLDRGPVVGWFSAGEIRLEAMLAGLALYVFVVHLMLTKHPFVRVAIYRDRNFLSGNALVIVNSVTIFATLALLAPLLQGLMQYSVLQAGLLMTPRGLGTSIAMGIAPKLMERFDSRTVIGAGLALASLSLWQMSHYSLQMDRMPVLTSGLVQGFGTGLLYVPMSTLAFATLPATMRNEATALFALVRNLGASVGIATAQGLLAHNIQAVHLRLAAGITPFTPAGQVLLGDPTGRMATLLNGEITRQAAMVAYTDDFHFMLVMTLVLTPLLLFVRAPRSVAPGVQDVVPE